MLREIEIYRICRINVYREYSILFADKTLEYVWYAVHSAHKYCICIANSIGSMELFLVRESSQCIWNDCRVAHSWRYVSPLLNDNYTLPVQMSRQFSPKSLHSDCRLPPSLSLSLSSSSSLSLPLQCTKHPFVLQSVCICGIASNAFNVMIFYSNCAKYGGISSL